jgi:hypothetical protein
MKAAAEGAWAINAGLGYAAFTRGAFGIGAYLGYTVSKA